MTDERREGFGRRAHDDLVRYGDRLDKTATAEWYESQTDRMVVNYPRQGGQLTAVTVVAGLMRLWGWDVCVQAHITLARDAEGGPMQTWSGDGMSPLEASAERIIQASIKTPAYSPWRTR
jgi:hypothetical protein